MGMTVCGHRGGLVSGPNIVPLIDVLLVLIIIFMVITPSVPTGLKAQIPQPSPPLPTEATQPDTAVIVRVMDGGKIMINQEPSNWETLETRLANIFKIRASKVAFVSGAQEVPFAQVAHAIDLMRGAGIEHVGLITASVRSEQYLNSNDDLRGALARSC
jgi:biopolymer transport protein TolR